MAKFDQLKQLSINPLWSPPFGNPLWSLPFGNPLWSPPFGNLDHYPLSLIGLFKNILIRIWFQYNKLYCLKMELLKVLLRLSFGVWKLNDRWNQVRKKKPSLKDHVRYGNNLFGPEFGTSLDLVVPLTSSWSSVSLPSAITFSMCASHKITQTLHGKHSFLNQPVPPAKLVNI